MFASRALFVPYRTKDINNFTITNKVMLPDPTKPIARIALWTTSLSESCDSLLSVSITESCGCEMESRANASGTERRINGSPYCNYGTRNY